MEVIFLLGTAQALFLAILVFNKKGKSHGPLPYEAVSKTLNDLMDEMERILNSDGS